MFQDREVCFLAIRICVVGLFVACSVIERRVKVRWGSWEDKSVQVLDFGGELAWRKLERQGDGFTFGRADGGNVILEFTRNPIGLFVRGAPGDAHTGASGCA